MMTPCLTWTKTTLSNSRDQPQHQGLLPKGFLLATIYALLFFNDFYERCRILASWPNRFICWVPEHYRLQRY